MIEAAAKVNNRTGNIRQKTKNSAYRSISTDTDQIGALNEYPLSSPQEEVKSRLSRKCLRSLF